MKKTILLILAFMVLFSFFAAIPAAAEESDMYYVNAQILKIFPHREGYYVIYRRAGLKTGEAFIPKAWLDRRDQRAVFNLVDGKINPYLSFMMKDGKFDHVRIMASRDLKHPTWGVMNQGTEINDRFKIEALELEF